MVDASEQCLFLEPAGFWIRIAVERGRKQSDPACRNLLIRPGGSGAWIDSHYHVYMVAHYGIGIQTNREDVSQFQQPLRNPFATVLTGFSVLGINATQPRPSRAS